MPHLVLGLSLHILSPNLVTSSFKMCHQVSNFSTVSSAPPGPGRSYPLDECRSPPVALLVPSLHPSSQHSWSGGAVVTLPTVPAHSGQVRGLLWLVRPLPSLASLRHLPSAALSSLWSGGAGGPRTAACTCLSSALHGPRTQQDQCSPPSASSSRLVVPGRPLPHAHSLAVRRFAFPLSTGGL